jgi:hypothetical protein
MPEIEKEKGKNDEMTHHITIRTPQNTDDKYSFGVFQTARDARNAFRLSLQRVGSKVYAIRFAADEKSTTKVRNAAKR